jgi:hypothetical protein
MAKPRNEVPTTSIEANDFPGLMLLEDPIDLEPGQAQDQLNMKSDTKGQLASRNGMLPVSFDFSL